MVLQQQAELLAVVAAKEIGACQRRLIGAGPGDEAVGLARVAPGHRVHADAHEGVAGAHMLAVVLPADEGLQCVAQVADAALVDRLHLGEGGVGVLEAGRGDEEGQ
jgi:hypothetical protein